MGTYLIPKTLQRKYRGAGHAMAAIVETKGGSFEMQSDKS